MSSEAIQLAGFVLPCAAAAAGALLAQLSAPLTCGWTMKLDELKTRLVAIRDGAPSALRSRLGTLLIGALMMGGSMAAYASVPAAPERLTPVTGLEALKDQVSGVVGSGDQLRLQLSVDGQTRTLNVGDEYGDGWVLRGLTNATATLDKGGVVRVVGLSPSADTARAAPSSPSGSQVNVLGLVTQDQMKVLQREIDSGRWDGRPAWGLDQDQTNRLITYDAERDAAYADWYAKNWVPGVAAMDISSRPTEQEILGADYDDYYKLTVARTQYRIDNYAAEMAGPLTGPSSILVPVGMTTGEAITSAGASPAGSWSFSAADTKGARLMTRINSPVYAGGVFTSAMAMSNVGTPKQ